MFFVHDQLSHAVIPSRTRIITTGLSVEYLHVKIGKKNFKMQFVSLLTPKSEVMIFIIIVFFI